MTMILTYKDRNLKFLSFFNKKNETFIKKNEFFKREI